MEKKYYAFISYSRRNSKGAAYVHRQLEHFRVPVKYVLEENRPGNQKFLRPVFRDKRDLETSEGSFTVHIKQAIADSRYLIVVCSPEAASSVWVNDEVKHFLATHNQDYSAVVPIILRGEPGAGSGEECLPEALRHDAITSRNLPSMIPDEGDSVKSGWENGVVQALSYMLKVKREKIKATVDAEKLRQAKIYAVIGIVAAVVFAVLTAWAIRAEREATANEKAAQEQRVRAEANEKVAQEQRVRAEAQEREAREQAELARNTLDYIKQMLEKDRDGRGAERRIKDVLLSQVVKVQSLEPKVLRASVSEHVGRLFIQSSLYGPALPMLEFAHSYYVEKQDSAGILRTAYSLGIYHSFTHNLGKAEEYYALAAKYDVSGNVEQAMFNVSVSDNYLRKNDLAKAERYALEAVKGATTDMDKALARLQLAKVYSAKHDMSSSFRVLSEIDVKILQSNPDKEILFYYYNELALYHRFLGQHRKALEYFEEQAKIIISQHGRQCMPLATCYNNMGECYQQLMDSKRALEALEKGLEIVKRIFPEGSSLEGQICNNLGCVYAALDNVVKGGDVLNRGLELRLRFHGEQSQEVGESLLNLAHIRMKEKRYDEALALNRRALKAYLSVTGEQNEKVGTIYNNLGEIYRNRMENAVAVEQFMKSLSIMSKVYGENTDGLLAATAVTHNNLALAYFQLGDMERARKHIGIAADYATKHLPVHDSQRRLFLVNKAMILNPLDASALSSAVADAVAENQRKADEARRLLERAEKEPARAKALYEASEKLYHEVLQYQIASHQELSGLTALAYNDLGYIMNHTSRFAEGVQLLLKGHEINMKLYGENHEDTLANLSNIVYAYKGLGEYQQAILYGKLQAKVSAALYGNTADLANIYNDLGIHCFRCEDYSDALRHYQKSLEIYGSLQKKQHGDMAVVCGNMGDSCLSMRRHKDAAEHYKQALSHLEKCSGDQRGSQAYYYNQVALSLEKAGDAATSLGYFRKALKNNLEVHGDTHRDVAVNCFNIAIILRSQKQYREAIGYLEKSLEGYLKLDGGRNKDVFLCYNLLGLSHAALNELDKAFDWHRKSYELSLVLWGGEDKEVAVAAGNVAFALVEQGKYSQAKYYAEEALKLSILLHGDGSEKTLDCYWKLADIHYHLDEFKLATTYYDKVASLSLGQEQMDLTMTFWTQFGVSLKRQGSYDVLKPHLEKHLARARRDENQVQVSNLLRQHIRFHADKNELSEMRSAFEEELALQQRLHGKQSAGVSTSYWFYGERLYDIKRYSEAAAYYKKSLETDYSLAKKPWDDIVKNHANIGFCFYMQGKYAEAVDAFGTAVKLGGEHQKSQASLEQYRNALAKARYLQEGRRLVFRITEAVPGGHAEKLGVKAGDIFLRVGQWNYGVVTPIPHDVVDVLSGQFDMLNESDKEIVLLRREKGQSRLVRVQFPPGRTGVEYTWDYVTPEQMSGMEKEIKAAGGILREKEMR